MQQLLTPITSQKQIINTEARLIMKAKILSGLLLLALTFAAPHGAEAAAKTPKAIADTYTFDGITYYNVNSQNFNSDKKFYVDVISTKHSAIGGRSIGDLWLMVAAGLGKDQVPVRTDFMGMGSDYLAKLKQGLLTGKIDNTSVNTINPYYYEYSAPEWKNSDGGYVETLAAINYSSGMMQSHLVIYTVRFSDFTVGALLPADDGLYVYTTTETGSVKNIKASAVKNDTGSTITASQSESRTVSETLSSTVNHSSTYSFTEGLKVGAEASSFGIYKMSVEMSAQLTQAFTDGWSKSEAKTSSKTTGSSVSVTLPAYTNVMIKQGEAETTTTTKYNCPVIVGYKVTITIEQRGLVVPNKTYTFGSSNSNARKDLNHRAFEEGSKTYDSQQIDWENILSDSDFKDAIQKITTHAPMSGSGATLVYTSHTTYSEVSGVSPLYPLTHLELGHASLPFIDNNNVANMKVGDYSYLEYLYINAYNSLNADYYGFDRNKGHWAVVDENMNEISGSNAPVVLTKDAAGHTQFKAVKPGKCYLKYFINENAYPTGIGSNTYTKNADIQTAILEINVADEEVKYEITGSYTGIVNSQPESIEGDDKLTVAAYDTEDIEVDRSYIWQKREKDSRGIKLTSDGVASFTKGGTFHVRVKDQGGSIYSDWVLITAEGLGDDTETEDDSPAPTAYAEEGTTFLISGSYIGGVSNDAESIEGSGKLSVTAHDSTGQELNVLYSWEARNDSDGMTLAEDGQVSFTRTGLYYVRVKSGSVYSEWTEIRANEKAPARLTRIPTPTGNTYTGESVDILASDVTCEGGTVVYVLGTDDSTVPAVFSSEMPTAVDVGTYYVWCKVLGDDNHDDSEPVCIVATIKASGGSESPTYEDDDTSDESGVSSSSGGCDSGMSVLILGVIFSVLVLRRKTR